MSDTGLTEWQWWRLFY